MEAPTICCYITMKSDWSYCPSCGEHIEWPPTLEQIAQAEEAKRARLARMESDPVFREKEEQRERFLAAQWEIHFRQFCEDNRPIPLLHTVTP